MVQKEDDEVSLQEEQVRDHSKPKTICRMPRGTFVVCTTAIVLALGIIITSLFMLHSTLPDFYQEIDMTTVTAHLQNFQAIADQNSGSRGILYGFNSSADYVVSVLKNFTNFEVTVQVFQMQVYMEIDPPYLALIADNFTKDFPSSEYRGMAYSGSGSPTGLVFLVSNYGCNQSDYSEEAEGKIALILRGNCNFSEKAALAQQFNAVGAIIIGTAEAVAGTLGASSQVNIPVISVSQSLGNELQKWDGDLKLIVNGLSITAQTRNILASPSFGDADSIIMLGSHLDSVNNGPGINDNGSGAAANLAIAVALYESGRKPNNKVVFAWWGAEEDGLIGSTYYANQQSSDGTLSKIAAYINLDMIGSPNFIRGVYAPFNYSDEAQLGSYNIALQFAAHFEAVGLEYEEIPFDGRSDYAPFQNNGIAVSGLTSGSDTLKTMEQRKLFGGLANVPMDPCYHHKCDSIENINDYVLEDLTRAAAHVFYDLAADSTVRDTLAAAIAEPTTSP